MNSLRTFATTTVIAIVLNCAQSAVAELHWPTWLGGKPETSKAHSKTKKTAKPVTADGKGKSKNLFTSTKDLFGSKPKSKTVSKWPSDKPKSTRGKAKSEEKQSWLGNMFKPSEPEPPRSVAEWMDLKQIKP